MADFRTDHLYAAVTPAQLQAVLSDGDYLAAKFVAIGFTDVEVVSASPTASTVRRTTEPAVPGWAKIVAGPQKLTEVHAWTTGDAPRGESRVTTSGAPVTIRATMELEAVDGGTMLHIRGQAKASVPLIGGKLSGLVAEQATNSLEREYAFTTTWIADHPPA